MRNIKCLVKMNQGIICNYETAESWNFKWGKAMLYTLGTGPCLGVIVKNTHMKRCGLAHISADNFTQREMLYQLINFIEIVKESSPYNSIELYFATGSFPLLDVGNQNEYPELPCNFEEWINENSIFGEAQNKLKDTINSDIKIFAPVIPYGYPIGIDCKTGVVYNYHNVTYGLNEASYCYDLSHDINKKYEIEGRLNIFSYTKGLGVGLPTKLDLSHMISNLGLNSAQQTKQKIKQYFKYCEEEGKAALNNNITKPLNFLSKDYM